MLLLPMAASAYDAEINGIFYNLDNKNKTAEVTYQYEFQTMTDNYPDPVTIPQTVTYNGVEYNVTAIGKRAFGNCTTLRTINIPSSVTSIGREAFCQCCNLKSINIPNSVTSIGKFAFYECSGLRTITISNSVTSFESYIFAKCSSLQNITIPSSVTSIGIFAFQGCSSLRTITIPNSVTSIGSHAFQECSSLQTITIPNSVTSIEAFTFYGCSSLQDITIPNSITCIGSIAFQGCSSLQTITIPNSVTYIGHDTFNGCSNLQTITIPNSVTNIENEPFAGCYALNSIIVESGNTIYDSRNNCNAIIETKSNTLINGCKNTIIPNDVINLGYGAFFDCRDLKSISIPSSVNSIGEYAFYGCSGLEKIICYAKDVPITESNAFDESDFENAILFVPVESLNKYKVTPPWSSFKTIKAIEDATTLINEVSEFKFNINVNGSTINILSEVEGQHISIYSIGGQLIGSTVVNNGSATINTSLKSGSIAVVKVGKKSVRVAIK